MSAKLFFDTNVVFYAYDVSDPAKQSAAQALLHQAAAGGTGVVSAQVLGEFFHATVLRKRVLTMDEAERVIGVLAAFEVVTIDTALVLAAIENHRKFQLRYWDALIVAAAKQGGCAELLSEDLNDGQDYDGVRVRNPFKSSKP
jgi:predicted nucleic acid-binding protein